jgi:hypothetical protein
MVLSLAARQACDRGEMFGELVAALQAERDRAAAAVHPQGPSLFHEADKLTRSSLRQEQALLGAPSASIVLYQLVAGGKQSMAVPASLALSLAAGAGERAAQQVRLLLSGVCLGAQFRDDALGWERELASGGAWALSLALDALSTRLDALARPRPPSWLAGGRWRIRSLVRRSGVVDGLFRLSRERFEEAARAARELRLSQLACWADERAEQMSALRRPGAIATPRSGRHSM